MQLVKYKDIEVHLCYNSKTLGLVNGKNWSMGRTLYWVNTRELDRELCTG